jgi:tetratricopeptide (TPR) repeat protein
MIYKTIYFSVIFIFFCTVTACQQVSKNSAKQNNQQETSEISEVNILLTTITIEALKEEDFKQAQRSIQALIYNDDDKAWNFIQSAMAALPREMALQIMTTSLKNPSVKTSSSQLFGLAKVLISFKNSILALDTVNQSIVLDENNLEARFLRARLLTVLKKYTKAESDFKYIIKKQPKNEAYSGQYASLLQETKQFDKAQELLSKHKSTPENIFKRIIFAIQNENTEMANSLYQSLKNLAVEQDAKNHKDFLIGESAYWLEKFDEGEHYYRQVSGGEHYLDARDMISLILFDKEEYDEALEILHQLQNAEQRYAIKAYRLESQINKKQGSTDKAIETLTRSLSILPNNHELLYDRAMLYESQNKMDLVEKDLLQILKDDPDNFEALNALGYSFADHGIKLQKAYGYIKQAISLSPNNAAIIDSLGWVQFKLGQYQEAQENFQKAMDMGIKDKDLYIHFYMTLIKLDKHEESKKLLEKATEMFPDDDEIKQLGSK